MKLKLLIGAVVWALLQANVQAGSPGTIELPRAKFAIGDDPARAQPGFDDSQWAEISTLANYEKQGFPGYDGYSWYRIHVRIPASLKSSVRWPQRLHLYLSSIDDVDETYLNGVKVGEMGQFPEDPRQYATRWNGLRDYYVDVATGLVHWDQDNVIAIRVYDGSGGGGFYRDMPTLSLAEIVDGLSLDVGQTAFEYLPGSLRARVRWVNSFPVVLDGRMDYEVMDVAAGKEISRGSSPFHVDVNGQADLNVTAPQRAGIEVRFHFTEQGTGTVANATLHAPYLLTPAESPRPRINGASVLGARPGSPIYYRVAVTGKMPLTIRAAALPSGLTLNAQEGVISGSVAVAGDYRIQLSAQNAVGRDARTLRLRVGDTLALTPPMGWNSWNAYGLAVDAAKVRGVAEAMISSGLAAHGWTYINIDDGWEARERAANGEIRSNDKFPDLLALSSYLHQRGLRFGIYSSPGATTCGRFLGSIGHERQDADSYARWGIDYLKYDMCSYELLLPKEPTLADYQAPYRLMGAALAAQTRDIVYSLCQYGVADVWKWGHEVRGNSWRTTGDIEDSWRVTREIMESQSVSAPFARPGHWNDPDMLVVGEVGWGGALHPSRLTPDEQYSHISLWSLLAAPLLLGNELTHLDAFTKNLLVNDEVIAIDQDPLGHAARKAWAGDDWEIWVRELSDGRKAVGVFNFGAQFRSLKLADRVPALAVGAALRDVWRQQSLAPLTADFAARVPAHGVLLLTVDAPPAPVRTTAAAPWWTHGVIYEIYLRSFQDSNGDGIGDLKGVTQRLDYLQRLGVDAIWITPFYPSPNADFGYDVSDYTNVAAEYGTLADWDLLVREAQRRHIRILVDFVLNHSSDQHPWFKESRTSRTNPRRDWYVWRDGGENGEPPTHWPSIFSGTTWSYDPGTQQWYYHIFLPQQPDLNWASPGLRQAMMDVARFWLQRGASGFRLDATPYLFEDPAFPEDPNPLSGPPSWLKPYNSERPEGHEVLRQLRSVLDSFPGDRVLLGESSTASIQGLASIYGRNHDEINLPMDFMYGNRTQLDAAAFKTIVDDAQLRLNGEPPVFFFSSHDHRRQWSSFGDGAHNDQIAKLTAALTLLLRGTALLYYGEELGVGDAPQALLDAYPLGSRRPRADERDRARTPMPWTAAPGAGFTRGVPWLPVAPQAAHYNVAAEQREPDSVYSWYLKLLRLRRHDPVFRDGDYLPLESGNHDVFAFARASADGHGAVVVLNMSGRQQPVNIAGLPATAQLVQRSLLASPAVNFAGQAAFDMAPYGVVAAQF